MSSHPPTTWMVRSPRGTLAEDWEEQGLVAIGYGGIGGDLTQFHDWKKVMRHLEEAAKGTRWTMTQLWQVARFCTEPKVGDRVMTYDTGRREYLYGDMGKYRFDPNSDTEKPHIRSVTWQGRIRRDDLSKRAKNVLGSSLTIFSPRDEIAKEIDNLFHGVAESPNASVPIEENEDNESNTILLNTNDFDDLHELASEQIKDRVMCLDDSEMEHLVAGVLRSMGYKTRVSPKGSDRGRDIIASPDGLGFEHPRIIVEVKHRSNAISAPAIRGLAGALTPTDRGLFVSTGGFTKDARYEADRANPPITLLDSDELVGLLTSNYETTDPETKALVPLKPLYWPA